MFIGADFAALKSYPEIAREEKLVLDQQKHSILFKTKSLIDFYEAPRELDEQIWLKPKSFSATDLRQSRFEDMFIHPQACYPRRKTTVIPETWLHRALSVQEIWILKKDPLFDPSELTKYPDDPPSQPLTWFEVRERVRQRLQPPVCVQAYPQQGWEEEVLDGYGVRLIEDDEDLFNILEIVVRHKDSPHGYKKPAVQERVKDAAHRRNRIEDSVCLNCQKTISWEFLCFRDTYWLYLMCRECGDLKGKTRLNWW